MLPVRNSSALRRAKDEALCDTARVALRGVLRNAAAPSDAKIRFVVLTRGQSDGLKIKPAMVSDQRSQPMAKLQLAGAVVEPIAAAQNLAALEAKAGAAAPTPSPSFEPFVVGSRAPLRMAAKQQGQWYASTSKHYIGAFNSDFEAACAYDAFVFEFCGDDGPNKADFSKEFDLNTMDEDKMELRKKAKKVGFAKAKAIRAQDQGVAAAREHSDAWSNHAIARSRAGADGPALVRDEARDSARRVPMPDGRSSEVCDAYVEAYASYIHEAAVQAVDADRAHRACWVALDVDNFRPSVQAAAHQQGLGHVIAHAESVCRRRLATIGLTVGPAFEDSLASFVAGLTAIASEVPALP